jgi:hypothetical protein
MCADVIKVCIDRKLPPDRFIEAAERAIEENPENAPVLRFRPGLGVGPDPPMALAAVTGKKWRPERTLRVRFLDGVPEVQAKVEEFAHQWSDHGDVKFDFGSDPQAEIRISFQHQGSWSYVGTDALSVPSDEPTMNYGWLTPGSPDNEYSRVVLHEFGHALACIHEHQHPEAGIPWDKEAVYSYYTGPPNNWTKAQVDHNLFRKYSASITQFSEFDPASIMLYSIPNAFTVGDFEVGWNRVLSATDREFIGVMYPLDGRRIVDLTVGGPAVEASIGEHGEEDLFQFAISTQGRYAIETKGWTDVVMALFGPDSQTDLVAEDDDSGRIFNAKIAAMLQPGTYYVRMRHYRPTGTGKYKIAVRSED